MVGAFLGFFYLLNKIRGHIKYLEYKTNEAFIDVNQDSKEDLIFLRDYGEERWILKPFLHGSPYARYSLMIALANENGDIGEAKTSFEFPKEQCSCTLRPLEIKLQDLTRDGRLDLVYLIQSHPRPTNFEGTLSSDYKLMQAIGREDLTFDYSTILQRVYLSEKPNISGIIK